jgi:predicted AAA+ superfamily ATPase
MSLELSDAKLTLLIQEIEKVRRRKVVDFKNPDEIQYLDPYDNLGKIKIANNHLILGRRGCGKTTLLLTTIKENNTDFILPLDCQVYREWDSEKIIIEILLSFIDKLKLFILNASAFEDAKKI